MLVLLLVLCASGVHAQEATESEKQAYCRHVQDVAEAERTIDAGLGAFGRLGQSDSNPTVKQAVVGASKSLSKHLQGDSVTRAAVIECELYGHSLDVALFVKYKLATIDRQVAAHRALGLQGLLDILDESIAAAEWRRQAGDATVGDLLALTQQRLQIHSQYVAEKEAAVQPEPPALPDIDVEEALRQIDDLTFQLHQELDHKLALQVWDVALIGGMQKPLAGEPAGSSTGYQPFVSVTFTYNFNEGAYKRRLDTATASLMELRRKQNDELAHQVSTLRKSLADIMNLQKSMLPQAQAQRQQFSESLERLRLVGTAEAVKMRSQMRIALAMATMEEDLINFKLGLLSK
jgi:hypothetical protein